MVGMDVEIARDVTSFDPELMQLQEVSTAALKEHPQVAEQLYLQWLMVPETVRMVKSLIDDVKAGLPLNVPGSCNNANSTASNTVPSMFPAGSAPPLSPRSTSGSPRFMKRSLGPGPSSFGSPLKVVSAPVREVIPQFYFQNGRPPPLELKEQCLARVDLLFSGHLEGLRVQDFKAVTREVCKLPSFISTVLFGKIDVECTGIVTRFSYKRRGRGLKKKHSLH